MAAEVPRFEADYRKRVALASYPQKRICAMNFAELVSQPHRRFNPLTREWVLASPHRTQRPWQGQVEDLAAEAVLAYDPTCYLCPGNARACGERNPAYTGT